MNKFPLTLAALAVLTLACQGQVLIDDHMEGYPTATSTSILPNAATSDPAFWEAVVYSGNGGSVTAAGGIGTANGNPCRAAVMNANFSSTGNASAYAGFILNSSSYGNDTPATQGNALSDFHFSVDLRGSKAAAVTVVFLSMDTNFALTGSMAKTFTLTAANTYQTFSGNLGEPGWAPDSSKPSGVTPLNLHAPYYGWSVLITAQNPGGWGFDSGNVLDIDNVNLTATSGSTYLPVTYDANGFFHLNSGQSTYVGYKPDTYSDANPISLLVWMHGCGGNAEGDMWTIAPYSSRQNQSYIAISIGGRDGDCWDVNTDTPKVLAAITDIARYFNINPRKIHLAGYSSGGDMTYRVGFQNASLFAGLLVENSDPFRDTGAPNAYLAASWKINVAHLAHLSDAVYPIAGVRTNLATLTANGFPVTKIEKAGTHYDPDNGASGTNYDLIHSLLPFMEAGWVSPSGLPEIAVEQPAGTSLVDGVGSVDFGTVPAGHCSTRTFTIRNLGTADLNVFSIFPGGPNAGEFVVTAPPYPFVVGPGGSTTFTVTFYSGGTGPKSAALFLFNNDADENPFDIALTATAVTRLEAWRFTYFGSTANSGNGADQNDFDHDGLVNVLEFATHRDPTASSTPVGVFSSVILPPMPPLFPNARQLMMFTYRRADAAVFEGFQFQVDWSDNLSGLWSVGGVQEEILNDDGTEQEVRATVTYTSPQVVPRQFFMRLRVTLP